MQEIGVYELKTHLAKYLKRVSQGYSFTITKNGVPIAVLQSYQSEKKEDIKQVIHSLREFRKDHNLGDLKIREMIEEGRK